MFRHRRSPRPSAAAPGADAVHLTSHHPNAPWDCHRTAAPDRPPWHHHPWPFLGSPPWQSQTGRVWVRTESMRLCQLWKQLLRIAPWHTALPVDVHSTCSSSCSRLWGWTLTARSSLFHRAEKQVLFRRTAKDTDIEQARFNSFGASWI